jgi:hypothetical protein
MVNFRKSLMVVALLALCASLASAQMISTTWAVDTSNAYVSQIVRAEGVTEAVPPVTLTVTGSTAAATYNVILFSSQPVTSTSTDIFLTVNPAGTKYQGTISGTSITFPTITLPIGTTSIVLTGVRIDATKLPSLASGASTGLGENLLAVFQAGDSATNASPFGGISPVLSITNLVFAVPTLAAGTSDNTTDLNGSKNAASNALSQCGNGFDPTKSTGGVAFYVTLAELYSTAWKTKAHEQAFAVPDASQGTEFSVQFTNVPSNTAPYVPVTVSVYNNADPAVLVAQLTLASTTGLTLSTDKAFAMVPAGGVVYQVTAETTSLDKFFIPVYVAYTGVPALTTSAAPVTATVMYAPQSTTGSSSDTAPIPRFLGSALVVSSPTFTINSCNSTILFPYVVSQPGYDTGLAISNVGNLSPNGGQTGTCQWAFYGDGAPTTALAPTAAIAPGTTQTALLSAMAPGLTGFGVATCQFQGGYGYAFIVGKLGVQMWAF